MGSTAGMQTSVDTSPLLKVGWMFGDEQHGEVGQSQKCGDVVHEGMVGEHGGMGWVWGSQPTPPVLECNGALGGLWGSKSHGIHEKTPPGAPPIVPCRGGGAGAHDPHGALHPGSGL